MGEMERVEQDRKREAEKLKNRMEEEAKQTQSGLVTMFERMKGENESRKTEIHGLKDILVRENEKIVRDQIALGQKMDNGFEELGGRLAHGIDECKKEIKSKTDDIQDTIKSDKKEVKDK